MKVRKRPLFLSDIEDCADYLFTEAGEEVARQWKESLVMLTYHDCSRYSPGLIELAIANSSAA